MFNRVAIVGAGSMGTLLGACLARAGKSAELVDVYRAHVDALNARGAHVTGEVDFTVPVRALCPEEMTGEYDLVFLMIKQTFNSETFEELRPHLHAGSIVCTLQNGLPEPAVAEAFGPERTMGCAVTWAATFQGPGVTRATTRPADWHSSLGRPDGRITPDGEAVRDILALMCGTQLVSNLTGIRWSKLLVNSSFSGTASALGCTFGSLLTDERALGCAQNIAREALRAAAAQGIALAPLAEGEDFRALMDFSSREERLATRPIYEKLLGASADGLPSMLQDLTHGRRTEIDAINGVVSAGGRACGVPTPFCDAVIDVVKRCEAGKLTPSMENLRYFPAVE